MGNHLDETILQEIQDSKLNVLLDDLKNQIINHKSNLAWKFLVKLNGIGFLRQIFKRLYINLFELYSIEKKWAFNNEEGTRPIPSLSPLPEQIRA